MRLFLALAAATTMMTSAAPVRAADEAVTTFDPLSIFAPALLERLNADSRCSDAKTAAQAVVKSGGDDVKDDLAAMRAFEKCSTLPRAGDNWATFVDYSTLGAATSAFLLGRAANEPRAYQRALDAAKAVHGYNQTATGGKTMVAVTARDGPEDDSSKKQRVDTSGQNVQTQGRVVYRSVGAAVNASNAKDELGILATEIGTLATQALAAKK